jgi:hypothetical protein
LRESVVQYLSLRQSITFEQLRKLLELPLVAYSPNFLLSKFTSHHAIMSTELSETDPTNILLAVDVPESACAGSTFHVELKNRFFEVISLSFD